MRIIFQKKSFLVPSNFVLTPVSSTALQMMMMTEAEVNTAILFFLMF